MTKKEAKREIAEYMVDCMVDCAKKELRLSGQNYYARIDENVYNLGSPQVWDYWDNDSYFWNYPKNRTKWLEEDDDRVLADHPYWDSDKCKETRQSTIDWLVDDVDFLGEPFDENDEPDESEIDFEYFTDDYQPDD